MNVYCDIDTGNTCCDNQVNLKNFFSFHDRYQEYSRDFCISLAQKIDQIPSEINNPDSCCKCYSSDSCHPPDGTGANLGMYQCSSGWISTTISGNKYCTSPSKLTIYTPLTGVPSITFEFTAQVNGVQTIIVEFYKWQALSFEMLFAGTGQTSFTSLCNPCVFGSNDFSASPKNIQRLKLQTAQQTTNNTIVLSICQIFAYTHKDYIKTATASFLFTNNSSRIMSGSITDYTRWLTGQSVGDADASLPNDSCLEVEKDSSVKPSMTDFIIIDFEKQIEVKEIVIAAGSNDKNIELFIVDPMNNYWMTMTTAIMAATATNPVNYLNGNVDLCGQDGLLRVYSQKIINNVICDDAECVNWAPKRVFILNEKQQDFYLCGFSVMGTFTCPPTATQCKHSKLVAGLAAGYTIDAVYGEIGVASTSTNFLFTDGLTSQCSPILGCGSYKTYQLFCYSDPACTISCGTPVVTTATFTTDPATGLTNFRWTPTVSGTWSCFVRASMVTETDSSSATYVTSPQTSDSHLFTMSVCPPCNDPANILSGANAPTFATQPISIFTQTFTTFVPFSDTSGICLARNCEKNYKVLCREQGTVNAFAVISHVSITLITGTQLRAFMEVLNAPTRWDCLIEASMILSDSTVITLQSAEFPVTFSACVNPADSCKLNSYSNNLAWVAPADMNVWTDSIPVSTTIDTDLCIDKILQLCRDPSYPGNLGAGLTTSLCAIATYELYTSDSYGSTNIKLSATYPTTTTAPITTYNQVTTTSPITVTLASADGLLPKETSVTVEARYTSKFTGIAPRVCTKADSFYVRLQDQCNPPACIAALPIGQSTPPANIYVNVLDTQNTTFLRFNDTIQVACPLVVWGECGNFYLQLRNSDGSLFEPGLCTVTQTGGSTIGTVRCSPTLFSQAGVYTVYVEAEFTRYKDGTKITTQTPSFTITVDACSSCPSTTLNPGAILPASFSIGTDGVGGSTTFSNFTNTAGLACLSIPNNCGIPTYELEYLSGVLPVTLTNSITLGAPNTQSASTIDPSNEGTYNVRIKATLNMAAYSKPDQVAYSNTYTITVDGCNPLPCSITGVQQPDSTMKLPSTMLIVTDGTSYSEDFSPYKDSVSQLCSARIAPFTYQDLCPAKVYKIYNETTNLEITFPYTIDTTGPNIRILISSTDPAIQGVHNVYMRVSMPGTTSIETTSKFQIQIEDPNPCANLDCISNELLLPDPTVITNKVPSNFTVILTQGLSGMVFTDFQDRKTIQCAGQLGNYKGTPVTSPITFTSPICELPTYKAIRKATGEVIDIQFGIGNAPLQASVLISNQHQLLVQSGDTTQVGVWEYYIQATLKHGTSIVSVVDSQSFWITIVDPCSPYDCNAIKKYFPLVSGQTIPDVSLKTMSEIKSSLQGPFTNTIDYLCGDKSVDPKPLCGQPTYQLVLQDNTTQPIDYTITVTATGLEIKLWSNNNALIGQSFNVKVRAFNKNNWPAEAFGPVFTVTIQEAGVVTVLNNPPSFVTFPPNLEYYQDVPYLDQIFGCQAIDSDGLVAKTEVEMITFMPDYWFNYQVGTDTATFKFNPTTGLPTGTITFKVTATDNNGGIVTKQFTVKIVPPPPIVVVELPKIINVTSLLLESGLSNTVNVTTPYKKEVPLIAWIQTIDSNGLMEVRYNKPVIPVQNLTQVKTYEFNVRMEQNSFEPDQTKELAWNLTYADPFRILVQLIFKVPIDVSQGQIKDKAFVCMQQEIFMIEDKWGLYRYWQGYNDTLNTTDQEANQTTTTVVKEEEKEEDTKYKKAKSKDDEEEELYTSKQADSIVDYANKTQHNNTGNHRMLAIVFDKNCNSNPGYWPMNHTIPLQNANKEEAVMLQNQLKFIGGEYLDNKWAPVVISAIMFFGSEQLWLVLGALQIIDLLPQLNLRIPLNFDSVTKELQKIAKLQIMPNIELYGYIRKYCGDNSTVANFTESFNTTGISAFDLQKIQRFDQYGAQVWSLVGSAQIVLLTMLFGSFTIVAFAFYKCFYPILPEKMKACVEWLRKFLYWHHPLRWLIEQYLCVALSCFLNLKYNFHFNTVETAINTSFAFVYIAVYLVLFPVISWYFLHSRVLLLQTENFKKQFDMLYRSVNYYKKSALAWLIVMQARRIVFAAVVVFVEQPVFQLTILLYTQNLMMQFLMNVQPVMKKLDQVIVVANETCISLLVIVLFALTDVTTNNTSRSIIGNFVTYILYGIIFGNCLGIVLRVIFGVQFWIARIRFETEMKQLRKDKEEFNRIMALIGGKNKVEPSGGQGGLEPIKEEDEEEDGSSDEEEVKEEVKQEERKIDVQNSTEKILPKYEKRKNRKEEFQKLMKDLKDPVADEAIIKHALNSAPTQAPEVNLNAPYKEERDVYNNDYEFDQNRNAIQAKKAGVNMDHVTEERKLHKDLQANNADCWPVSPRQIAQPTKKKYHDKLNKNDSWGFDNEGVQNMAEDWNAVPEKYKEDIVDADEIFNRDDQELGLGKLPKKKKAANKKDDSWNNEAPIVAGPAPATPANDSWNWEEPAPVKKQKINPDSFDFGSDQGSQNDGGAKNKGAKGVSAKGASAKGVIQDKNKGAKGVSQDKNKGLSQDKNKGGKKGQPSMGKAPFEDSQEWDF